MFRFTIRDALWLAVIAAIGFGWWADHTALEDRLMSGNRNGSDAALIAFGVTLLIAFVVSVAGVAVMVSAYGHIIRRSGWKAAWDDQYWGPESTRIRVGAGLGTISGLLYLALTVVARFIL